MLFNAMQEFFGFIWSSMLLLSPMLLLGLFLSGLIHVFISRQAIHRWFKRDNLKTIASSAAVGVPMPLCSCSVVPVVTEMRRKGASRSACISFLITAPETGVDSILITNVLFGWVAAVVRPVIAFFTAVVAGLFCRGLAKNEVEFVGESEESPCESPSCEDEENHSYLVPDRNDCFVSVSKLTQLFFKKVRNRATRPSSSLAAASVSDFSSDRPATDNLTFSKVARHVFRYGFIDIADDIYFSLLVGIALGGILYLVIPSDLLAHEYARWISYPVMLLVAVPMYICATASTPIAAALVAKGCSPGAALIFLMTGPATNTATITVVLKIFGARFASIYVGVVVVVTVLLGIAIDMLILSTGYSLVVNLEPSHSHTIQTFQYVCAIVVCGLIIWRFREGALKSGWEDLIVNIRPLLGRTRST